MMDNIAVVTLQPFVIANLKADRTAFEIAISHVGVRIMAQCRIGKRRPKPQSLIVGPHLQIFRIRAGQDTVKIMTIQQQDL